MFRKTKHFLEVPDDVLEDRKDKNIDIDAFYLPVEILLLKLIYPVFPRVDFASFSRVNRKLCMGY